MRSFISELRRRNVDRAAVFYAGASWLLVQVATQVFPFFHIEESVVRAVVVAAAIGFPFALLFSWFYEWTPQGIKRESEVDRSQSVTPRTGKALDRWIIAVMAVAIVLLLTDHFLSRHDAAATTAATPAVAVIPDIDKDPSIAVLPFDDLSAGKDQQYFSDGISEELLNLLAKVPKLRVIARASSFSFRGKDASIADIAGKLHVAALLEGSLRKSGNTVRLTVQLIRASDSSQLWSENYDRTLDDIFKVQDEIAAQVVDKLKLTLLGAAPTVRPVDPRAYPLILQGNALTDQGSAAARTQAIAVYQQALAIAPDEPRAWAGLGRVYFNQALFGQRSVPEGARLAKEALHKALALDPSDARTYANLGRVVSDLDNDPAEAALLYQKALALDPADLYVINSVAIFLGALGRLDEAAALLEYRAAHDPANPIAYGNLGAARYYTLRWDQAIAAIRTALALSPDYTQAHYYIGLSLLLGKGDAAGALKEFQAEPDEPTRMQGLPLALHALGRKAESDAALAALIARHAKEAEFNIATVYAWRGEADQAFEWLDRAVADQDPSLPSLPYEPLLDKLHQDPRWPPLLCKLGKTPEQLAKIQFKVTLPAAERTAAAQP